MTAPEQQRIVLEVHGEPQRVPVLAEPARTVVEVLEENQRVLYVVEPAMPPAFDIALDDLTDVDTSGVIEGDVLTWLAGVWQPAEPSGSGPGNTEPYRHDQIIPASLWHVQHNLGYDPPACYVIDGSGVQSWPDRIRVNDNEFSLNWGSVLATGSVLTR